MAQAGSLRRTLGPVAVALLTLSVLSPAASVFIAGADIVHQAGTGAGLAFVLGGVLLLVVTFAQAELGSAFPFAGGDYAMIGQVIGPRWGFAQFGLDLLSTPTFLALTATGISLYLRVVAPGLPAVPTAIVALAASTGLAALNVRTGALVTGLFFAVELAALGVVATHGLLVPARSLGSVLVHPLMPAATGLVALDAGTMAVAVASAMWAISGSGQAIYFGEELRDPARVGRLVIRITLIAIATMVAAVLGLVVGARDLPATFAAESPFAVFIAASASPGVATLISLGIAAAIFNANLAGVICYGRWLWSSARDKVWPAAVNRRLLTLHPRFGSPWVASLVVGLVSMAFCALGLRTLVVLSAANGIANWVLLNAAGIAGRRRGLTGGPGRYRAPLFPLTHLASFAAAAALAVLAWQDAETGRKGEFVIVANIVAALAYHRFVLARRPGGWAPVAPSPAT